MVSKKLMAIWGFLDVCLLAAGAVAIAFSLIWKMPNPAMNLVFSANDLTVGTILGAALLVTFAVSIFAIVQRSHVTLGLVILNWLLLLDALGILIIGTFLWVFTLMEQNNFRAAFTERDAATRLGVQDKFQCCGYFTPTDALEVGSFCSSEAFAVQHNTTCVLPITNFGDVTLNDVFTTIYGFMAVALALFLASLCIIKERQIEERFQRIDLKRGGRGFV